MPSTVHSACCIIPTRPRVAIVQMHLDSALQNKRVTPTIDIDDPWASPQLLGIEWMYCAGSYVASAGYDMKLLTLLCTIVLPGTVYMYAALFYSTQHLAVLSTTGINK